MKEIKERTPLESARRSKISAISFISAGQKESIRLVEICEICG